jgi:hypothetical protein
MPTAACPITWATSSSPGIPCWCRRRRSCASGSGWTCAPEARRSPSTGRAGAWTVKNGSPETGETYRESYDSAGAVHRLLARPPAHSGHRLAPHPDAVDRARHGRDPRPGPLGAGVRSAAVIGGGFIGVEMAENLRHAGLDVSIVEMLDQVMAPLDFEMAQLLHEHMESNGVRCTWGTASPPLPTTAGTSPSRCAAAGPSRPAGDPLHRRAAQQRAGQGRRPCALNARGGVVTDSVPAHLRPGIYAVGDVAEVEDLVFGDAPWRRWPARPTSRAASPRTTSPAGDEVYAGAPGHLHGFKVFDLTAATTGASEKALIQRGLVRGRDYETVYVTQNSHAGYYPGAVPMTIKLLFALDGKKLFGAQIVGRGRRGQAHRHHRRHAAAGRRYPGPEGAGAGLCAALLLRQGPGEHGGLHRPRTCWTAWCALRTGTRWSISRTPCCWTCARRRSCLAFAASRRLGHPAGPAAGPPGGAGPQKDRHPLLRHRRAVL